jgi:hypothetical protein
MEDLLNKMDVDKFVGQITLTNGGKLNVPKITVKKIVKIVKFLGLEGMKIYNSLGSIIDNPELDDITKIASIFDVLNEEQLIRIFSILLDLSDEEALNLDANEMLDIVLVYLEKTNITKTFTQVRQIYKVTYKKDLPDISTWIQKRVQAQQEIQRKKEEALKAAGNPS